MRKNLFTAFVLTLVYPLAVFSQCPTYGDAYDICSDGSAQTIRFVLKEDVSDCFDNGQTTSKSIVFGLSPSTISFVPGSATVVVYGDLDDLSVPNASSTSSAITINNLQISNGGQGEDELDSIEVFVSVQASGPGVALIDRQGGDFSIGGGFNPLSGSPIVSINASEMTFASNTITQTVANATQGSVQQELMRVAVKVSNGGCPFEMKRFNFDYTGVNINDISKVQIWDNGSTSVFNPLSATLYGEVNSPSLTMSISGSSKMNAGNNYFFITVDVPLGAVVGNVIDLELKQYEYDDKGAPVVKNGGIDFVSPTVGDLTVSPFLASVINIGGCGVPTIEGAFNGLPDPLDQNYILELCPNYDPSGESYPIILNDRDENGFEVIIRPRADVTSPIQINGTPANPSSVFGFFGCDYVTLDGRSGGVGSVRNLIIRNTTNDKELFRFMNGTQNNKIQYVEIQGRTNASFSGLVNFLGSTTTESNSNNSFTYNKFSDDSGNNPGVAIYSLGDAGKSNERNVFENNEFINVWQGNTVSSFVFELSSNTSGWTIKNNHFYQTNSYSNNNFNSGFIYVEDGSGFEISNNYFGGNGVNASGGKFLIDNGSAPFDCIYFGKNSKGGSNVISGNVISNIEYVNQVSLLGYPAMSLVYNEGENIFNINNNTFGSIATNSDIRVVNTNGGATAGFGFMGVVNDQAINNRISVVNNVFAGISISGDSPFMDSYMVINKNEGTLVVEDNLFGGTLSNSIDLSVNSDFIGVRNNSTVGVKMRRNMFQNINHIASSGVFVPLFNGDGDIEVTDNVFKNLYSETSSAGRVIHHLGNTYKIEGNSMSNIEYANNSTTSFELIYINSTSGGDVNGNTIGGSGSLNIKSNFNGDVIGISKNGAGGVINCENNVIQGFHVTNSVGTESNLKGIEVNGGVLNATGNEITNFYTEANVTTDAIVGIALSSASLGHIVKENVIHDFTIGLSASISTNIVGVSFSSGSGKVESNYIYNLFSEKTNATAYVRGFNVANGDWDIYNNVIWLSNPNGTGGYQCRAVTFRSIGTIKFYHNTIKLESVSDYYIAACLDINANGFYNVSNNSFYNLAGGSWSSGKGAKTVLALSAYANPVFRNNYHECAVLPGEEVRWGGVTEVYDIASWNLTAQVSDDFEGNETVNNEGYAAGVEFAGKGFNLITDVPQDKDGATRTITPWVGAYESANLTPVDTIIMNTFTADTLCTYFNDYNLVFSAYGTFNPGNRFIVQLSDGLGSFTTPTNLDTLITDSPTIPDTISVDMTSVILPGDEYRVRIISTDNALVSNDNGDGMVINQPENLSWTGAVSTDWFNCSNWDLGRVPGMNSDVSIPNTINKPLINSGVARCFTLSIDVDNGANVTVNSANGASLQVSKP